MVKTLLLIGVGLGSFDLLNPAAAATADRWASALAWRLDRRAAFSVRNRLSSLRHSELIVVGIVVLLYAGLFAVEGVGSWKSRRGVNLLVVGYLVWKVRQDAA